MFALLGALGLALNPVNTATRPILVAPINEGEVEPEPTPTPTEEDWKTKVQELMDKLGISNIITYCLTGGTMVALIVTFAKYKAAKYKTTMQVSKEIEDHAIKYFTDYVTKYYDTKLDELVKSQAVIENNMNVLVSAFVLSQDTSYKGKACLLEYLDRNIKTEDKEVKETISEQQERVDEVIKKEEAVIEKLNEDEEEPQPQPVE